MGKRLIDKRLGLIAVIICITAIASCGGGGSGSSNASTGNISGYVYAPIGGITRSASTPAGYQPLQGADVTCDGKFTQTNINGYYVLTGVPMGSNKIVTISKPGYGTITKTGITVNSGQTTVATAENSTEGLLTLATSGSILVTSSPDSASIYIDSTSTGLTTPQTLDGISPGTHSVYVSLLGYVASTQTVIVSTDEISSISLTMEPVVCYNDADCSGSTPYCANPAATISQCVGCTTSGQCESNQICQNSSCISSSWAKIYGGLSYDKAYSIQQTSDGGYIIAGETKSYSPNGNSDIWIIKIDAIGDKEWDVVLGGTSDDRVNSIQQTIDGGYIAAGYNDGLVIKLDSEGNTEWVNRFGESYTWIEAYSVLQTSDRGYIMAGKSKFASLPSDAMIIKIDASGNKEWKKTYGGDQDDVVYSIQITSDGGYILAGFKSTYESGCSDENFWIFKLNSDGEQEWETTYGDDGWYGEMCGMSDEIAYSALSEDDGGYLIAGHVETYKSIEAGIMIIKLDSHGNQVWTKILGETNDDIAYSIQKTSDGGYVLGGMKTGDFMVQKLDGEGNQEWVKMFGGTGDDIGRSAHQTSDGGFIIGGYTASFGVGSPYQNNFLIYKLDSSGNCNGCFE